MTYADTKRLLQLKADKHCKIISIFTQPPTISRVLSLLLKPTDWWLFLRLQSKQPFSKDVCLLKIDHHETGMRMLCCTLVGS